MNKKQLTFTAIAVSIAVSVSAFWWFQIRPSQIKSKCQTLASKGLDGSENSFSDLGKFNATKFRAEQGDQKAIDELYRNCIRHRGL